MIYFFIERMNNAKRNVINNEETNAFEEIYLNQLQEIYDKYDLPALHEFGDGFVKGDATKEECDDLVKRGLATKDEDGYDFSELDILLCDAVDDAVEKYNKSLK